MRRTPESPDRFLTADPTQWTLERVRAEGRDLHGPEHPAEASLSPSRREIVAAGAALTAAAVLGPTSAQSVLGPTASEPGPNTVLPVRLVVNGRDHAVAVDPRQSLLDVLRETLDLTGTKKGCNQGACGACTVLLNGNRVVSCLTLAAMHDGSTVETIEGLARGDELHPLQTAFVEHDAFQCGFCTPGQIMSGIGCISEGHARTEHEIQFWMSGNLCRCGAYPGVVAAIADVAGRT